MRANRVINLRQGEFFSALVLAALGFMLYGFTIFYFDYFRLLKQGENGKAAIQMLDQMRRPFLALKQAELYLMQSAYDASALSKIENSISDGSQKLAEYLELASYNKEAQKQVLHLKSSYESWVSLELELARISAAGGMRTDYRKMDTLLQKNSAAFLTVMDVLGDGEGPIHHDIEAGAAAARDLLISSLIFIAYLIAVVFWREWVRHRRERQYYEKELQLSRLALMDGLTGLANRTLLDDRLSLAIAKARRDNHRLGILYFDLDGFKPINDELGHEVGDSVLKEVALRLKEHTREMDTVARVGGDEFIVVTPNLRGEDEARLIADKIQIALSQPLTLCGKQYQISASLGIAMYPENGEQAAQLIKHADTAMYQAKRASKSNSAP